MMNKVKMTQTRMGVRRFETVDSDEVNRFIRDIQLREFGFSEKAFPQPELWDIAQFYQSRGDFWVARLDREVVGTVAILDLGEGVAKLGRLFVHPDHRGVPLYLARNLLKIAEIWAADHLIRRICFETTVEPCAAHGFYGKHGYQEIFKSAFPAVFPLCPYPSRYFMKMLPGK
jgi:N-acetylglutamate synthase-like GNAT family acetyltransferase